MTKTGNWSVCRIICWALALIGAIAVLIGMSKAAGVFLGLILGLVTLAVLGFLFTRLVCIAEPDDAPGILEMGRNAVDSAKRMSGVIAQTDSAKVKREAAAAVETAKEKTAEAASSAAATASQAASAVASGTAQAASAAAEKTTDAAAAAEQKVSEVAGTADPAAIRAAKGEDAAAGKSDRPAGLPGPRMGKPDNLKQIKGVGPKLEKLLHSMGYYHLDQIAGWSAKEVEWVDNNLEGFRGRVSRDNWVKQAKTLAAGGETEFSKRVDDGDVY